MLSTPRRRRASLVALALGSSLALAACGGGGFEEGGSDEPASSGDGPVTLEVLIGSSGDAETKAVEDAAAAWAEESGNEVEVIVANDLAQQLSQGFAGGNPPDLFYVDAGVFGDYAEAGNLYPYLDQMADADDFYPNLVDSFTLDGEAYCAPKDFSTLALQINTDVVEEGRPHRRRHPHHLGRAAERRPGADHPRPGRPGARHRSRPRRRVPRAERRLLGGRRVRRGHRDRADERRGAGVRPGHARGRRGRARTGRRRRLGRRGLRHAEGRDDHRGQLDPRRDGERLPRRRATPSPSCRRARPARAPCSSPSAGASPPTRRTRRRPSPSSRP